MINEVTEKCSNSLDEAINLLDNQMPLKSQKWLQLWSNYPTSKKLCWRNDSKYENVDITQTFTHLKLSHNRTHELQ